MLLTAYDFQLTFQPSDNASVQANLIPAICEALWWLFDESQDIASPVFPSATVDLFFII